MLENPSAPWSYPATFTFDPPEHVANWRPLLSWLLVLPQFVVLYALQIASQIVGVISWFAIVFTGNMPEGLATFQVMYLRYAARTYTYLGFLREEYPPFTFATTWADPGDDPRVRVDVQPALTDRNRLTVAFRIILAFPQAIALMFVGIALNFVYVIAFFFVLFTGHWTEGLRDFVIGVSQWYIRFLAYALLLTDKYPPFGFD
jgi:hypothetical protein